MKFCPNCNNNCIITKLTTAQQYQMTKSKELSDTSSEISPTNNSESNKKQTVKVNEMNKNDGTAKAYFKCTNCDYLELIEDGTMILSRTHTNTLSDYYDTSEYAEMVNDKTLPHTRNYVCPNKSCKSQNDYNERDAVWFKPSQNNYAIKMICTSCKTTW